MTYKEWLTGVPEIIRADTLWRVEAYRLALFLSDVAWEDATKLLADPRTRDIADQLYRAACKISSHISEGYSRSTGKSRAVFYDYALGSSRETRDWYYKGRRVLEESVATHRMELATKLIRLTITMTRNERRANRKLPST
jgi:four helix bundle protein